MKCPVGTLLPCSWRRAALPSQVPPGVFICLCPPGFCYIILVMPACPEYALLRSESSLSNPWCNCWIQYLWVRANLEYAEIVQSAPLQSRFLDSIPKDSDSRRSAKTSAFLTTTLADSFAGDLGQGTTLDQKLP